MGWNAISLKPCKTCKFWGARRPNGRATCFRYPPHPHPNGGSEWPMTGENDACGEHVPARRRKHEESTP